MFFFHIRRQTLKLYPDHGGTNHGTLAGVTSWANPVRGGRHQVSSQGCRGGNLRCATNEEPPPRHLPGLTGCCTPLVVEAITRLTHTVQVHRVITEDFENDLLVGILLALHDAGVPLQPVPIRTWVTTHH